MAIYDRDSNSFIIEDTDRQTFSMPEDAGAASVYGRSTSDILFGNTSDNKLDGREGADALIGGSGSDTYYVDNIDDQVVEDRGFLDRDTVVTSVSYTLGSYLEDMTATGADSINLTGNELINRLIGNDGDNVLDGGMGGDLMSGGAGNDTYHVDSPDDQIVEWDNQGLDHVVTTVSQALRGGLENLTATGSVEVTLSGNDLDNAIAGNTAANFIYGNAGRDTLNGGGGSDVMEGGVGDDVYYVDSSDDKVLETGSGGTADRVYARSSYTLASYVEQLYADGSGSISLTGNGSSNTIVGNGGANKINGGSGRDYLTGGTGRDAFIFSTKLSKTSNLDKIIDYKMADDTIYLENAVFRKLTKTGTLSKSSFVLGSKAKDKDDFVLYDKVKGYLYYDADGSGKGAAVAFAKLAAGLKMASSEFKVI
jgi:Ca2+-binding RTX toxin-like protein